MSPDATLLTMFHTVRHLKPVQIRHRIYRGRVRSSSFAMPRCRAVTGGWTPEITSSPARTGSFRFKFLNQEREPRTWNDDAIPRLWLYNLHYFDFVDPELLLSWVSENPIGVGSGWEPYPLSRRIVNWIKWQRSGHVLPPQCLESLALQAEFLSNTIEYRLLTNHLFANAKAMVFAGLFFSSREAEKWLRKGLEILDQELGEQILGDGGHFERSPMYHSLILEDLLDLINLSRVYPETFVDRYAPAWKAAAARMLGWLRKMSHPDGQISFFNDASFGIAPKPAELYEYAERLGLWEQSSELADSGYLRLEDKNTVVLFDAAPIGPDYQPGHGHADALSFEVSHRGSRMVVNSGTSTYEPGPERTRQRGTAAHNTVEIDGTSQSEVWSSFRVGRRARPFDIGTDNVTFVEAAHDGYRRISHSVVHRRRVEFTPGGLLISDTIQGTGTHDVRVYFHVHPNARAEIRLDEKLTTRRTEDTTWHPEFNLSVPNQTVVGHFRGIVPITFRSLLVLP